MSKRNNVNPGQYKVAGRDRPGNQVAKTQKHNEAVNRGVEVPRGNKKKR